MMKINISTAVILNWLSLFDIETIDYLNPIEYVDSKPRESNRSDVV